MISKELLAAIAASGLALITLVFVTYMCIPRMKANTRDFWHWAANLGTGLVALALCLAWFYYKNEVEVFNLFKNINIALLVMALFLVGSLLIRKHLHNRQLPKLLWSGNVTNNRYRSELVFNEAWPVQNQDHLTIVLTEDGNSPAMPDDFIVKTTISVYRKKT